MHKMLITNDVSVLAWGFWVYTLSTSAEEAEMR